MPTRTYTHMSLLYCFLNCCETLPVRPPPGASLKSALSESWAKLLSFLYNSFSLQYFGIRDRKGPRCLTESKGTCLPVFPLSDDKIALLGSRIWLAFRSCPHPHSTRLLSRWAPGSFPPPTSAGWGGKGKPEGGAPPEVSGKWIKARGKRVGTHEPWADGIPTEFIFFFF